jgi:type 1 glutamine amidotransferase
MTDPDPDLDGLRVAVLGTNDFDFHRIDRMGPLFAEFLAARTGADVDVHDDRAVLRASSLAAYDVLVDYTTRGHLTDEQWAGLDGFVSDGGGYVGLHGASAVEREDGPPHEGLAALVGGTFEGHGAFCRLSVDVVDRAHPVTRDVPSYSILDEPYECRVRDDARVLAEAHHEEAGVLPMAWSRRHGDGRVYYCANGHDERALVHPTYQRLVARGAAWTAGVL